MTKTRLGDLAAKLPGLVQDKTRAVKVPHQVPDEPAALIANRPHGEKGDHVKVTVTLPPEIYKLVADEASRRKMAKEANPQLSAIIREALVDYIKR